MRDYAKLSPQFWINATGRKIKQAGLSTQLIALYLITNPHATMLGLYYLPITFIAHETGLSLADATQSLHILCQIGFCSYDDVSEYIWVHEMAAEQIGASLKVTDNRIKAINEAYLAFPNLSFLPAFYAKYKEAFHLLDSSYRLNPLAGSPEPLHSQEQAQEQQTEQEIILSSKLDPAVTMKNTTKEQKRSLTSLANSKALLKAQATEILNFLNEKTGRTYRPVDANLKLILARLESGASTGECYQVIAKKTREWQRDPKMANYLRPATLFNATKFEQYVGELVLPGRVLSHESH
jgi:uncharacterized phage protein (TIGR02220 family)